MNVQTQNQPIILDPEPELLNTQQVTPNTSSTRRARRKGVIGDVIVVLDSDEEPDVVESKDATQNKGVSSGDQNGTDSPDIQLISMDVRGSPSSTNNSGTELEAEESGAVVVKKETPNTNESSGDKNGCKNGSDSHNSDGQASQLTDVRSLSNSPNISRTESQPITGGDGDENGSDSQVSGKQTDMSNSSKSPNVSETETQPNPGCDGDKNSTELEKSATQPGSERSDIRSSSELANNSGDDSQPVPQSPQVEESDKTLNQDHVANAHAACEEGDSLIMECCNVSDQEDQTDCRSVTSDIEISDSDDSSTDLPSSAQRSSVSETIESYMINTTSVNSSLSQAHGKTTHAKGPVSSPVLVTSSNTGNVRTQSPRSLLLPSTTPGAFLLAGNHGPVAGGTLLVRPPHVGAFQSPSSGPFLLVGQGGPPTLVRSPQVLVGPGGLVPCVTGVAGSWPVSNAPRTVTVGSTNNVLSRSTSRIIMATNSKPKKKKVPTATLR